MKQKTSPGYEQNFRSPHLYFDDLEAIEEVFRNQLKPKELSIYTEDFKYSHISEFNEKGKTLNKVRFSSYAPSISVNLYEYGASIVCYDQDLNAIGASKAISDIIIKRERKLYDFLLNKFLNVGWIVGAPASLISKMSFPLNALYLSIFLIYLILVLIRLSPLYKSCIVESRTSDSVNNFLERNKDQLAVGIIAGVIGTVIGTLITLFFTNRNP